VPDSSLRERTTEEGVVARDQQQDRADRDPTGSRKRRVNVLRDLIADRGYDVPAEDVAASIIRDAIVIASPAPQH
jgi:anti-sigma28 factor (negative regulator of flagellin synthesis)